MAFDRRYLLLLILPLTVYALVYAVLDPARPMQVTFPVIDRDAFPTVAGEEARQRYFWLSAFTLLTAVALGIAMGAALSVWRLAPRRDRGLVFLLMAVVLGAVAAVELSGSVTSWYVYLGKNLFLSIFPYIRTGEHATAMQAFLTGQAVIKIATAAALVPLAVGLVLTLSRPAEGATLAARARSLASATEQQKAFLRHAALLYVLALLAVWAWMYWPIPFLKDPPGSTTVTDAYNGLATGALLLQGVAFSIGVAAIYLPPALLLRHRAALLTRQIEDDPSDDGDEDADAVLAFLSVHPIDYLRQALALVLPALVSLLPSLQSIASALATG
ncbi:MAG: hypothetical protein KDC18_15370 [Alphaproteobacteria bacterium]|nr:hypothetical protein [Alphaproteobacteria bacterium]MCB9928974.1 hypothetical protein [Alphaproteobacteria bacterium]